MVLLICKRLIRCNKQLISCLLSSLMLLSGQVLAEDNKLKLPDLGGGGSIFSAQHEHQLGRAWLRMFRNRAPVVNDPLLEDYLYNLIYRLASKSELQDRRLELVVVNNRTINAFAVPGGIIGIHNGLLLAAQNESELATVLAHEIAHLSQRHYARSVEEARRNALPNLAALLASIAIAATAGGDAGIAAITATQAASLQNQLRYSRLHEQEADRIGMDTLVNADFDPYSAPAMFERMLAASRYSGERPYEFLLTHPVTEKRIADTRSRAQQFPKTVHTDNLDYQLMQTRVEFAFAATPQDAIKLFQTRMDSPSKQSEANRYGLVLAYIANGQWQKAEQALQPLSKRSPDKIAYLIADAEIKIGQGEIATALTILKNGLALSPRNNPLTISYANALLQANQAKLAEQLLIAHSKYNPNNSQVWYLLAETHGLAGNTIGVHQARAEYFLLNGVFDQARKQLFYALPLAKNNSVLTAQIKERVKYINELENWVKQIS